MFDDKKGNTDSTNATSLLFDLKFGPLENNSKVMLKYISREIEHFFSGKINETSGVAVAPLILMFKKEILKGATSKHAKQMYFGYETGQHNSDFKKQMIFR